MVDQSQNNQGDDQGGGQIQVSQQVPQQPVGSPLKEGGPIGRENNEWIKESSPEIEIGNELKEIGVEKSHEAKAEEAKELKKVREELLETQVTPQAQKVFPMTRDQVLQILKVHKKVKDSIVWLAMLIKRQFEIQDRERS